MEIPKYIQDKMHSAAKHFQKGYALMADIEEWLVEHYGEEYRENGNMALWRAGNGCSLEEIECGFDVTDEFVEWAGNDFVLESVEG